MKTSYCGQLENLRDQYKQITTCSSVGTRLAKIQRYFDTCDLVDEFKRHVRFFDELSFYMLDCDIDYSKWIEKEIWKSSITTQKDVNNYYEVERDLIRTRVNYMQDHLTPHNKSLFDYDKRDKVGTALNIINSDSYFDDNILDNAYDSAIEELISLLSQMKEKIENFKPTNEHYVIVFESFDITDKIDIDYAEMYYDYNKKKEDRYINDFDDLKELRLVCFTELADSGFFLNHQDDMTATSIRKLKEEVDFDFVEDEEKMKFYMKCYTLFRKLVEYKNDKYIFTPHKIGKYLYQYRKELTNMHITTFKYVMFNIKRIQEDMYPENAVIPFDEITDFDAQAVLDYVAKLNTDDKENNRLIENFWKGLINRYAEITHESYNKTETCFKAARNEDDKSFSKVFVCSVIGYLSNTADVYKQGNTEKSILLGEGNEPDNPRIKNMQQCLSKYDKNVERIIKEEIDNAFGL